MRRSVGVGAIRDKKAAQEKFKEKRDIIQENLVEELSKQLDQFRTKLESFAAKHRNAIRKDPSFRRHFQEMCASIGVDPLASSKGFWSELLGMGSFYYEVAVQAVEVVLSTAYLTGGVMKVGELQSRLNDLRSKSLKQNEVSCDDVIRAIKSLDVLGKSCGIIQDTKCINENYLVFCVPEELSLDNTTIIQYVCTSGEMCVQSKEIETTLGWGPERINTAMEQLIKEGIVWIDIYQNNRMFWFPSLFFDDKNLGRLGLQNCDMEV